MTNKASQVLLGQDRAIEVWLRDRFGINVDEHLIANGITIYMRHNESVTREVRFLVGADDLNAFPEVSEAGHPK